MTDLAKDTSINHISGVEIRFVRLDDNEVTVRLYLDDIYNLLSTEENLYYGCIQFGWEWNRSINLRPGENKIVIPELSEDTKKYLAQTTVNNNLPFSSKVVRLVLPSENIKFIGVSGNVRPPKEMEVPSKQALFYGSSITHGSIAPSTENYTFLCSQKLGIDILNYGFAGTCYLEKEMVDYIFGKDNISFYMTELCTNCWNNFEIGEVKRRVSYLMQTFNIKQKDKKLFVIDGFVLSNEFQTYRDMVKQMVTEYNYVSNNKIIYICGRDLIKSSAMISSDGVHPSALGHRKIFENLVSIIKSNM